MSMRKVLALVFLLPVLLSGCSSPEPSYDPVELIEYENCLKNPPEYATEIWGTPGVAESFCKDKKPVLK